MVTREQKQKREQRTKQRKKPCRYQNSSPENSPADIKIVSRTEAATGGVLSKKVLFEISQNLLKKTLRYRCFPVNFAKFLRTLFYIEHLRTTASARKKADFRENRNCCLARSLPSPANITINSSW